MNPLSKIPDGLRLALYALYAVAGPVLIYTASRGWTGESEYALWVGIGSALTLTAASNVSTGPTVNEYVGEHRAVPDEIALGPEGINAGDYEDGPDLKPQGYTSGV